MTDSVSPPGHIIAKGVGVSASPQIIFKGVPIGVGASAGTISDGNVAYLYASFSLGASFSAAPLDVTFEFITLSEGRTPADLSGAGFMLSVASGSLAGTILNSSGEVIGILGGVRSNLDYEALTTYTFVSPPIRQVSPDASIWAAEGFPHCFSAGTPILLADGRRVAIEDIRAGMRVAAFDETDAAGSGPLHAGRVTRLIPGITTEWIVLDDGTRVTPGHRYLRPDGSFMAIGEIIAGDGLVVDARGNVTRVTGTLLRATDAGSDATWIAPDAIAATAIDNPGANFGDLVLGVSIRFVMAPISQELEPLANPGRSGRIQPTAS